VLFRFLALLWEPAHMVVVTVQGAPLGCSFSSFPLLFARRQSLLKIGQTRRHAVPPSHAQTFDIIGVQLYTALSRIRHRSTTNITFPNSFMLSRLYKLHRDSQSWLLNMASGWLLTNH
jgi:hypothetical protein